MAKRKPRTHHKQAAVTGKRGKVIVIGILFRMLIAGSGLAAWRGLFAPQRTRANRQVLPPAEKPTPERLNAINPTKDYIYAGGKLLVTEEPQARTLDDLDGDSKAEIGYYRTSDTPSQGVWDFLKSSQNYDSNYHVFYSWGGPGRTPVMGDFDGDGKVDIGYIEPPVGSQSATYAIRLSSRSYSFAAGQVLYVPAGYPSLGDTPVVADFDGDGKADPAIWRASQGIWIIPTSSSNYTSYIFKQWGQQGDVPCRPGRTSTEADKSCVNEQAADAWTLRIKFLRNSP
ncbi:MAG: hypothetical protein M3362_27570 [Acidobacteriota bacterium]|nr:hypothetical protein [Acidobacteriota bacterium]